MSAYARQLRAPTAYDALYTPYPDADPRPSVVLNQRTTYVLTPDATGRISFILGAFAGGCITLLEGKTNTAISRLNGVGPTIGGTVPGFAFDNSTDGTGQLPLVTTGFPALFGGRSSLIAFRPLVAVAECAYTGTSFSDSGSVTIGGVANVLAPRGSVTIDAPTDYSLDLFDCSAAGNIARASTLPSSRTFAARNSFSLRVAPSRPMFASTEPVAIRDNDGDPLGFFASAGTRSLVGTTGLPAAPYSGCCPWKAVVYDGLASTTTITVCVRYSAQYVVDDGSDFAAAARPSPAGNVSAASSIEKLVQAIPVVEPSILSSVYDRAAQVDWFGGLGRMAGAYSQTRRSARDV